MLALSLGKVLGGGLEGALRATPHKAPAGILAHELGHAKFKGKLPKPLRKLQDLGYSYGPTAGMALQHAIDIPLYARRYSYLNRKNAFIEQRLRDAKGRFLPGSLSAANTKLTKAEKARLGAIPQKEINSAVLRSMAIAAAANTPKLLDEAMASYYGLKGLKKLQKIPLVGKKLHKRSRTDLGLAFGTYLGGAMSDVAGTGLTKAWLLGSDKLPKVLKGYGPEAITGHIALRQAANFPTAIAGTALMSRVRKHPGLNDLERYLLSGRMGTLKTMQAQMRAGHDRNPLGAFFAQSKLSPAQKKAVTKIFGARAARALESAHGMVHAPRLLPGEGGMGKAGPRLALLNYARAVQRGDRSAAPLAALTAAGAGGAGLGLAKFVDEQKALSKKKK